MDDALAKRTPNMNHTQLEILVSYMEKNPSLAVKNLETRQKRNAMWNDLEAQLNAVFGGAQKTLDQWRKAWSDQKTRTHFKAMKLIETGGRSLHLTPFEERILKILILHNEFKSPEPSSDVFLIPETGIVFSMPIVAQEENKPSVSQDVLNTPSTSPDAPETSLVSQELHDSAMSESSNNSVTEVLPIADTHKVPNAEPSSEAPFFALSSRDIPFLIKRESQDNRSSIAETPKLLTDCSTESSKPIITNSSTESAGEPLANARRPEYPTQTLKPALNHPSPTTTFTAPKVTISGRGCKRSRSHLRSHYMTADKAAETFRFISERNCAVLERIASAMESQASRAAKQTQLMQEIVNLVKRK